MIPTFNSEGDVVKENSIYYQVAFISNTDSGNVDLLIDTTNNALKLVARRNGITDYDVYKKLENELSHKDTFYLNYVHTDDSGDIIGAESNSIFKNEYQPFKLSLIDDLDGIYLAMYRADPNERVDISKLYYANLCKRLDDEYTIINLNKENSTFKLADRNGEPVNLINFLNRNIQNNFKAEISLYTPVKAYYITAPFTLGDLMYNKTIWAYTITNDTNMSSSIELCRATNNIDYEKMISLAKLTPIKGFDTEEMSFNKIDFERIVIPKKITFVRPILVPFICFGFRSNDNENAILCAIQIVYTKNEISVGKGFN